MKVFNLGRTLIGFVAFALLSYAVSSQGALILSFDSSPDSPVGRGQSFTVTPEDGYIFITNDKVSWDNSQHITIASLNSPYGPDWNSRSGDQYHYWTLDLAAPNGEMLDVGLYEDAARWPYQDDAQAGLTFYGDHRANFRNSGFFNILDIGFDDLGILTSLAVDFAQYGEYDPDRWVHGSLRFNSSVPLPEPSSLLLIFIGLLGLTIASTKARRKLRGC